VSLPNQKSAAKNYGAANSEIGNQTAALPIQKLAARNCVAADSEIGSDGGVISFYFSFFFPGVYNYNGNNNFPS
jgi:hypothetical protein